MTTIVVGVDDSSQARDAVAFTRPLALALEAELLLVNAYPYEEFDSAHVRPEYEAWVAREARDALERHQADLAGVPTRTVARGTFSPARALHEAAETEGAVALVVGATRRAVEGHVALGSTAERLLAGAPCPVVVVPDGYARGGRGSLDLVGVAYQPTGEGPHVLAAAAELAQHCTAKVRIIEVADPRVWRPDVDAGRATFQELSDAQREVAHRRLEEAQASVAPAVRENTLLLVGDPVEELVTESAALDLLVCGSRDYGPVSGVQVGGVSKGLMHSARCPVMAIPRGWGAATW